MNRTKKQIDEARATIGIEPARSCIRSVPGQEVHDQWLS